MPDSDNAPPEPEVTIHDISEYTTLLRNPNQGTERGYREVEDSFREGGAGRSTLVANDRNIVAGNISTEVAADVGLNKVVEVATDGDVLIVHRRRDWENADDPQARQMAYRDNTSAFHGWTPDPDVVAADQENGYDFSGIFRDDELAAIVMASNFDPDDLINNYAEGLEAHAPSESFAMTFVFSGDHAAWIQRLVEQDGLVKAKAGLQEIIHKAFEAEYA